MKFDKESAEKKRKIHTSEKVGKRAGFIFLKAFLLGLAGLAVIVGAAGFGIMKGLINPLRLPLTFMIWTESRYKNLPPLPPTAHW